jgi:hypothetical protein
MDPLKISQRMRPNKTLAAVDHSFVKKLEKMKLRLKHVEGEDFTMRGRRHRELLTNARLSARSGRLPLAAIIG